MPYFVGGVVGLVLTAIWIYSILDVIATDSVVCRNLPKPMWLIFVVLVPAIGSAAWWILGRPERASYAIGGKARSRRYPTSPAVAPRAVEDMPDWPRRSRELLDGKPDKDEIRRAADERSRKLREWEAGLIKREKALDDERRRRNDESRKEAPGEGE